jgi:uncharacterized protein with FMN-binding domain
MRSNFCKISALFGIVIITALFLTGCWADFPIETPDLQKVGDGTYIGEYKAGPVRVKASVAVTNHSIAEVKILEHDNGLGKKAEAITNSILQKQSLNVDVVSGATLSSKVILKAVEIGLSKGIQ